MYLNKLISSHHMLYVYLHKNPIEPQVLLVELIGNLWINRKSLPWNLIFKADALHQINQPNQTFLLPGIYLYFNSKWRVTITPSREFRFFWILILTWIHWYSGNLGQEFCLLLLATRPCSLQRFSLFPLCFGSPGLCLRTMHLGQEPGCGRGQVIKLNCHHFRPSNSE